MSIKLFNKFYFWKNKEVQTEDDEKETVEEIRNRMLKQFTELYRFGVIDEAIEKQNIVTTVLMTEIDMEIDGYKLSIVEHANAIEKVPYIQIYYKGKKVGEAYNIIGRHDSVFPSTRSRWYRFNYGSWVEPLMTHFDNIIHREEQKIIDEENDRFRDLEE